MVPSRHGHGLFAGIRAAAAVGHPARATWDELVKKWRKTNLETFGLAVLRPFGRASFAARAVALPASAVAHTPKVLFQPAPLTMDQRFAALRVLYKMRMWRLANSLALLSGRK